MRSARALAGAALLTLLLAGCSAGDDPGQPTAEPTTTSTSVPTSTPTPDEQAAVLDVYYRYWDATVAAQRGNPDPELFADNATGSLVEEELAQARYYQEYGIVREGEPTFSQVGVTVSGDAATVVACVDQSAWDVREATGEALGVYAMATELSRLAEGWRVVTASTEQPPDLSC